ncbi:hypothetical protein PGT21_011804 [Puccinia graminis f. sp. tritici]|nr:hypothetical protein PGT21_011804 [Puccinia graminis f. sp. tritici]
MVMEPSAYALLSAKDFLFINDGHLERNDFDGVKPRAENQGVAPPSNMQEAKHSAATMRRYSTLQYLDIWVAYMRQEVPRYSSASRSGKISPGAVE